MTPINTVAGTISPDRLGKTMMHEHLTIGTPGWELDTAHPGPNYREMLAICVDRVSELKDHGIKSFVDPCPSDLGRDPRLAAEVAQCTGMQIILATGLFSEIFGNPRYWRSKFMAAASIGQDPAPYLAELYIKDIIEGINDTGVHAGIIKVGTHTGAITDYERVVLRAAALASLTTGVPITTHTQQGELGMEQQALLTDHGVPSHRLVIGHSDGSPDHAYHMHVIGHGSYLGFDRWGYQTGQFGRPDIDKIDSLIRIIRAGGGKQVVVSCDYVCCWKGSTWPTGKPPYANEIEGDGLLHFVHNVVPKLREAGLTDAEIDRLMIDNPRRYFSDTPI